MGDPYFTVGCRVKMIYPVHRDVAVQGLATVERQIRCSVFFWVIAYQSASEGAEIQVSRLVFNDAVYLK